MCTHSLTQTHTITLLSFIKRWTRTRSITTIFVKHFYWEGCYKFLLFTGHHQVQAKKYMSESTYNTLIKMTDISILDYLNGFYCASSQNCFINNQLYIKIIPSFLGERRKGLVLISLKAFNVLSFCCVGWLAFNLYLTFLLLIFTQQEFCFLCYNLISLFFSKTKTGTVHISLNVTIKWWGLLFCIQRVLTQISSQRTAILIEDFCIYISSHMKIPEQYLTLYNDCWLQNQRNAIFVISHTVWCYISLAIESFVTCIKNE